MSLAAFPDLHLTVEDILAEGDEVTARFTIHGVSWWGFPQRASR